MKSTCPISLLAEAGIYTLVSLSTLPRFSPSFILPTSLTTSSFLLSALSTPSTSPHTHSHPSLPIHTHDLLLVWLLSINEDLLNDVYTSLTTHPFTFCLKVRLTHRRIKENQTRISVQHPKSGVFGCDLLVSCACRHRERGAGDPD